MYGETFLIALTRQTIFPAVIFIYQAITFYIRVNFIDFLMNNLSISRRVYHANKSIEITNPAMSKDTVLLDISVIRY